MEEAREARRQRLVNRGTDRLAFITGQTNSLPHPPSYPLSPAASPRPVVDITGSVTKETPASFQIAHVRVASTDPLPISSPPKIKGKEIFRYETVDEYTKKEANNYNSTVDNQIKHSSTLQLSPLIPTPSRISRAISASENIRLVCAVVIAFLAVLSHQGYFLSGKIFGDIFFRPLVLLFVTDAAIVFGSALVNPEHCESSNKGVEGEKCWTNDISKVVEIGLLLRKAMNAVSMDYSLCAVIMISGFVV